MCGLWTAYCVLHSYMISTGFTKFAAGRLKKYYSFYRLFYVIISLLLLIILINYTGRYEDKDIIEYNFPWSIIRFAAMYGSLLLFFWAFFFCYDALSFFGIRQILNYKKMPTADSAGSIKKNGLLGIIRHPMYLALIIFLWSTIFTLLDLVINALLTVYVLIGTILEEKKLVLEFGDAYLEYQDEVPMLIPFVNPGTARLKKTI